MSDAMDMLRKRIEVLESLIKPEPKKGAGDKTPDKEVK